MALPAVKPGKLGKRWFGGAGGIGGMGVSIGIGRARLHERCQAWDLALAIAAHRALAARLRLVAVLAATSRLGDGFVWYALVIALPAWGGPPGVECALQMVLIGVIDLLLYWVIKRHVARPRPYVNCPHIRASAPALDRYSFPSGHTLHAVANGIVLAYHYPALMLPLAIAASLLGASRVVLGLHYPSDVLAGAALGACTASLVLVVWA